MSEIVSKMPEDEIFSALSMIVAILIKRNGGKISIPIEELEENVENTIECRYNPDTDEVDITAHECDNIIDKPLS
jgi:hypothetical protein